MNFAVQGTAMQMGHPQHAMHASSVQSAYRRNYNNKSMINKGYLKGLLGKILYEDRDMMIFSNIQSPFAGNQNPIKPEGTLINNKTAGMSALHLLVIPKRYIFNAVSLTDRDADLINKMAAIGKSVGKATVEFLNKTTNNIISGPKRENLKQLMTKTAPKESDFLVGFHVMPKNPTNMALSHSTGHLHMHVVYTPWKVKNQATFGIHSDPRKFVSAATVLAALTGRPDPNDGGMSLAEFQSRRDTYKTLLEKPNITNGELKQVTKGLITGNYNGAYTPAAGYVPFAEFGPGNAPLTPNDRAGRMVIRKGLKAGAYMKTGPFKAYTNIIKGIKM